MITRGKFIINEEHVKCKIYGQIEQSKSIQIVIRSRHDFNNHDNANMKNNNNKNKNIYFHFHK